MAEDFKPVLAILDDPEADPDDLYGPSPESTAFKQGYIEGVRAALAAKEHLHLDVDEWRRRLVAWAKSTTCDPAEPPPPLEAAPRAR